MKTTVDSWKNVLSLFLAIPLVKLMVNWCDLYTDCFLSIVSPLAGT
jgi:hypothetical protein